MAEKLNYAKIKEIGLKEIDYFMISDRMVFPIGFEQSGHLVIQDENYCLHIVKDEKDIENWTIKNWKNKG